jgi:hypothetical protein
MRRRGGRPEAAAVHSNPDARERHAVRLGVAGAVLAFLALTTVQAVAIRPYLPPDELCTTSGTRPRSWMAASRP